MRARARAPLPIKNSIIKRKKKRDTTRSLISVLRKRRVHARYLWLTRSHDIVSLQLRKACPSSSSTFSRNETANLSLVVAQRDRGRDTIRSKKPGNAGRQWSGQKSRKVAWRQLIETFDLPSFPPNGATAGDYTTWPLYSAPSANNKPRRAITRRDFAQIGRVINSRGQSRRISPLATLLCGFVAGEIHLRERIL